MNGKMKIALIVAAALLLFGGLLVWQSRVDAAMTAEATAMIMGLDVEDVGEETTEYETTIHYRFTADGQEVEAEDSRSGDQSGEFRVGQQVRICYNPENTRHAEMSDRPCGK